MPSPPTPSLYDRFLQWGMRDIAGPMAPGLANIYQQQAQQNAQAAQAQQNQFLGPEAQGHNPLVRFGHGLASVGYEALGVGDKMLGGLLGMNPGQALLTTANPRLGAAVLTSQSAPDFWQQSKRTVQAPTPENLQNFLLGGSMIAGAAAAAGSPTAPVGQINRMARPRGWALQQDAAPVDPTTINGSGNSSASLEAINRSKSEASQGVRRVVVDTRSGLERPLIGPDAVDYQPRPHESVEFRGGARDGEVISSGAAARPYRRAQAAAAGAGAGQFAEWPEQYRQAGMQRLTSNNAGGANYTPADLAAFKAKHGIKDAAPATSSSEFVPVPQDEYANALRSNRLAPTLVDPADTGNYRRFGLNINGKPSGAYYSLSPTGEISGVVNNGPQRGLLPQIMQHAIENGGTNLNAWDINGALPSMYSKYGFRPTKFEPYDAATYGEPSDSLKQAWRDSGWKDTDPYPGVQYMERQSPQNTLNVSHWSNVPDLTETDPAKFGTGKAGAERSRQNDPGFLPRTYFGMEGYREPAIQGQANQYSATLDASRYYDIAQDPKGIWQQGYRQGGPTGAEQAVRNAGYSGYHYDGTLASFDKVPVQSVPKGGFWQKYAAATGGQRGFATPSALTMGAFDTTFDPSRFDEESPGPANILAPFGTTPAKRFKSIVPDSIAQHLTPGWENLLKTPQSQQPMMDLRKQMASPDEVEAAAQLGQGSSFNWYPMSRQLGNTLEDAGSLPQGINSNLFNRTLASTSPQTNVPRNLAESLELMHNINTARSGSAGIDPLADPQTFANWLDSHSLSSQDKIILPHGGDITLAGSKRPNLARMLNDDNSLGGIKVSSFWGDLNQGNFGTMDSISQKGMGAGEIFGSAMGSKIFKPAPYMAARSIMSEVAARHGVSVDQIQASQWTPSRMINDSTALQNATPAEAISHITDALNQGAPSSDYAHIALDALEGKHQSDPRYSAWKKDYERVNQALRELHGNDAGKINDFTDALRTRIKPLEQERAARPLGEPASRPLRRVIGRTQRSITAAGASSEEE